MSRRISNWDVFSMVNACLLMVLMVTAVPTSSAIRRITRIPTLRGLKNHGFGDFDSLLSNGFSIGEQIPGIRRPTSFSIRKHIPGIRRPGKLGANRIRGFDLQTASSFQQNSFMIPPSSFQSNFNPAKPITLSPSSSLMFVSGLPNGYKPSSDIFDEEESISIGKLEAFLIHGDGEKPNPGNFEMQLSHPQPYMPHKQRPRQPRKNPIMSESHKILDHGPGANLIIPFPNSIHDIRKNNHLDFKAKRKPNNLLPHPDQLITRLRQHVGPQDTREESIRHIPLPSPVSGPKELHIIIHNPAPIQQVLPKDGPPHLPARQQNYGALRNPPLQQQFDTGHSGGPMQTQLHIPQKLNEQSFHVTASSNVKTPQGGHAPPRQIANSALIPQQGSNIPSSEDTRQVSTLLIQPSFASSFTPQMTFFPHSSAPNPNLQINSRLNNYPANQLHPQITHNPPTTHQEQSTPPAQQQAAPVVQLPQQSVHGNHPTHQNVQQNYASSSSQNDHRVLQQNVQVQQPYIPAPPNPQQSYIPTFPEAQRILQNPQQNYASVVQNDQRLVSQNVQPNYISSSQNNPSVLQQNGSPRPPSLVSSVQSSNIPLSQNVQPGHSASVSHKHAVGVQQADTSHPASNIQYKQVQQAYFPAAQNFGFSTTSQLSTSSAQLSQGNIPQNVQSSSLQNRPPSTIPNVHQSYISGTSQVSYGSPEGTSLTHFGDQRDYSTAPQNVGTRTVTHSTEQQSYASSSQPSNSEKPPSQTFTLVQTASHQKTYSPQSQNEQFYSATDKQDTASSSKPTTFTVNPSSQTTAKYILVKSSDNSNIAGNNVVYSYKLQGPEAQTTSSSSTGYVTRGPTYNKDSSSVYVSAGTKYSKDLSDDRDSDTSYARQISSTSVSSNTFTKNSEGSDEEEEFEGEESTNNASYKVVYIPLNILKNFLTKGPGANKK